MELNSLFYAGTYKVFINISRSSKTISKLSLDGMTVDMGRMCVSRIKSSEFFSHVRTFCTVEGTFITSRDGKLVE